MWNLFKNSLVNIKKHLTQMIGLTLLITLSIVAFTVLGSESSNLSKNYNNAISQNNTQDYVASTNPSSNWNHWDDDKGRDHPEKLWINRGDDAGTKAGLISYVANRGIPGMDLAQSVKSVDALLSCNESSQDFLKLFQKSLPAGTQFVDPWQPAPGVITQDQGCTYEHVTYLISRFATQFHTPEAGKTLAQTYNDPANHNLDFDIRYLYTLDSDQPDHNNASWSFGISTATDINKTIITEGALPTDGQILISPVFAKNNNLKVGDSLNLGNIKYTISGFGYESDFLFPALGGSYLIPNPETQTIGLISRNDLFRNFLSSSFYSTSHLSFLSVKDRDQNNKISNADLSSYFYYQSNPEDKDSNHKQVIHLDKDIYIFKSESYSSNVNPDVKYIFDDGINSGTAYRIGNVGKVIGQINLLLVVFLGILLISSSIIIIMILKKIIDESSKQIGVMESMGYNKFQVATSFMPFVIVPTAVGTILGYIGGMVLQLLITPTIQAYAALPLQEIHFDPLILIASFIPFVFLLAIAYGSTLLQLRKNIIKLMTENSSLKSGKLVKISLRTLNKMHAPQNAKLVSAFLFKSPGRLMLTMSSTFVSSFLCFVAFIAFTMFSNLVSYSYDNKSYHYSYKLDVNTLLQGKEEIVDGNDTSKITDLSPQDLENLYKTAFIPFLDNIRNPGPSGKPTKELDLTALNDKRVIIGAGDKQVFAGIVQDLEQYKQANSIADNTPAGNTIQRLVGLFNSFNGVVTKAQSIEIGKFTITPSLNGLTYALDGETYSTDYKPLQDKDKKDTPYLKPNYFNGVTMYALSNETKPYFSLFDKDKNDTTDALLAQKLDTTQKMFNGTKTTALIPIYVNQPFAKSLNVKAGSIINVGFKTNEISDEDKMAANGDLYHNSACEAQDNGISWGTYNKQTGTCSFNFKVAAVSSSYDANAMYVSSTNMQTMYKHIFGGEQLNDGVDPAKTQFDPGDTIGVKNAPLNDAQVATLKNYIYSNETDLKFFQSIPIYMNFGSNGKYELDYSKYFDAQSGTFNLTGLSNSFKLAVPVSGIDDISLSRVAIGKVVELYNAFIYIYALFTGMIAFIILLVITNMIFADNKKDIAILETLGKTKFQTQTIVIGIYGPIIVAMFVLSVPFSYWIMQFLISNIFKGGSRFSIGNVPIIYSWPAVLIVAAIIIIGFMLAYIASYIALRKINLLAQVKGE